MKRSYLVWGLVATTLAACGGGSDRHSGGGSTPPPAPAATNSAPTIAAIASQSILLNAVSDPVALVVADAESDTITIAAESSNPELLSGDAIAVSGDGAARTLILTPRAGAAGTAKVTMTATDSKGASSQQSFDVTVTSEQRSFRELVGTAFGAQADTAGEPIVGYSLVDTAEDDPAAFDNLLAP